MSSNPTNLAINLPTAIGRSEVDTKSVVEVPLLSFIYVRPADGLPLLHHWILVLKDIIYQGFETWRETMEVKPVDQNMTWGSPLEFGMIEAAKGLGRLSMIFWCILRTYYDRLMMTDSEKESFGRLASVAKSSAKYFRRPRNIFWDHRQPKIVFWETHRQPKIVFWETHRQPKIVFWETHRQPKIVFWETPPKTQNSSKGRLGGPQIPKKFTWWFGVNHRLGEPFPRHPNGRKIVFWDQKSRFWYFGKPNPMNLILWGPMRYFGFQTGTRSLRDGLGQTIV